jgi:hypothetical protein
MLKPILSHGWMPVGTISKSPGRNISHDHTICVDIKKYKLVDPRAFTRGTKFIQITLHLIPWAWFRGDPHHVQGRQENLVEWHPLLPQPTPVANRLLGIMRTLLPSWTYNSNGRGVYCEPKAVPTFSPNPLKLLGDVLWSCMLLHKNIKKVKL